MADLQPLVPLVLAAFNDLGPGLVHHIGA
jgi:hypothetical protein